MTTQITIVAGLGYSDEGKGHIIQLLTDNTKNYSDIKYDVIMRTNGSWSSSHQVDVHNKLKCFHLPSVMKEETNLIVGPGMYVYPNILLEELEQDFRKKQNIYICDECFVIENEILQSYKTNVDIGTLGSGVRNTSIKKLNHHAKKLKDIVNNENFTKLKKYLITDDEYFNLMNGKNE
jgi:adenylosuccinate synthase